MAFLNIPKNYASGEPLLESDLDDIRDNLLTFINTTKLNDDNIQPNVIDGASKFPNKEITASKLNAETYDDSTITLSGGSFQLKDGGITTAKIKDLQITRNKLSAADLKTDNAGGTASDPNWSVVGEVSLTTSGRPVLLLLDTDGNGGTLSVGSDDKNTTLINTPAEINIRFTRDQSDISGTYRYAFSRKLWEILDEVGDGSEHAIPCSCVWYIDEPAAGTYTYAVEYDTNQWAAPSNTTLKAIEV